MTKAEVFEEVRSLLSEAQLNTVEKPWHYTDADIVPQVRSAIRFLTLRGLSVGASMDKEGTFTTEPTDMEGGLIALFVAAKLLGGDLLQKLADGEMGVIFKAGSDLIDTKAAGNTFSKAAADLNDEFRALFTIALTNGDGGINNVFGGTAIYVSEP